MAYTYNGNGDRNGDKISINIEQPTNIIRNKGQLAQSDWKNENEPSSIENGPGGFSNLMNCMEIDWGNASWNGEEIKINDLLSEDGGFKNIKSSYDILRLLIWNSQNIKSVSNEQSVHVYKDNRPERDGGPNNENGVNKLFIGDWYLGWIKESIIRTDGGDEYKLNQLYPIQYLDEITYSKNNTNSKLYIVLNGKYINKTIKINGNNYEPTNSSYIVDQNNNETYFYYKISGLSAGQIKINITKK